MDELPGLEVPAVTRWLAGHVSGAVPPFTFRLIAGGHSNLTYLVSGADGRRFVVRRPPLGALLSSAHDIHREHMIISCLRDSSVPVATALGYCDDPSVNGGPFYVMGFVDGHVLRSRSDATRLLTPEGRRRASESLVDTMLAMHAVDLEMTGLSDLSKPEGYIERQLQRWYGQWNQSKHRDLAAIDDVYDVLRTEIPQQRETTIVHGDYRLDNCMVDDAGRVVAVLDWEICALGDPLADLGLLSVFWCGPNDESPARLGSATRCPGFFDRSEVAARYATLGGRDISQLPYYVAFGYWKLACVMEGVNARYLAGPRGEGRDVDNAPFTQLVDLLARAAVNALERIQ